MRVEDMEGSKKIWKFFLNLVGVNFLVYAVS